MMNKYKWRLKILWEAYLWFSEVNAFFNEDEADFMKDVFGFVSS